MTTFLATPVEITPGATGSWQGVDVSPHVATGATGVIVRASNAATNRRAYGIRKNGSTDELADEIAASSQQWDFCGLDNNGLLEAWVAPDITLELVGYFGSEAVFFTNAVSKGAVTTAGVYEDVDISADTGADTAIAALGLVHFPNFTNGFAVRKKGSSDNHYFNGERRNSFMVGLDGSETFQTRHGNLDGITYIVGYLTSGVVMHTNAILTTPPNDASFEDHTLDGGSDATGAVIHAAGGTFGLAYGARKNGSSLAWNADLNGRQGLALVGADASGVVEVYLEDSDVAVMSLWEIGYFTAGAVESPTPESPTDSPVESPTPESPTDSPLLPASPDERLLDLVPNAAAAWSVARLLRSAYSGALIRLRRDSDDTEQDFSADAAGDLDTAAVATFGGGASLFFVTIYDQSGNDRHATQAVAASQPAYVANGVGGKPSADFRGGHSLAAGDVEVHSNVNGLTVIAAVSPDTTGPVNVVSKYDPTTGSRAWRLTVDLFTVQETGGSFDSDTVAGLTAQLGDQVLRGQWTPGGAPQVYRNGTLINTADSAVTDIEDGTAEVVLGWQTNGGGSSDLDGRIAEAVIYADDDQATADTNIRAYYALAAESPTDSPVVSPTPESPTTPEPDVSPTGSPTFTEGSPAGFLTPRSFAPYVSAGEDTSHILHEPKDVQTGDLLLMLLAADGGDEQGVTADGWTPAGSVDQAGFDLKLRAFTRTSTGADPYTVELDISARLVGAVLRFDSHATTTPIEAVATDAGTGSNVVAPDANATVTGACVVRFFGAENQGDGQPEDTGFQADQVGLFLRASEGTSDGVTAGACYFAGDTASPPTLVPSGPVGEVAFTIITPRDWGAMTIIVVPEGESPIQEGSPVDVDSPTDGPLPPATGDIYFVDADNGDDSNTGLAETDAWATAAKVNSESFNPGDHIRFRRGTGPYGRLVPPSAGTASDPITIGAWGSGANPTFRTTATGTNTIDLARDHVHLENLAVIGSGNHGVNITSDFNEIKFCLFRDCRKRGISFDLNSAFSLIEDTDSLSNGADGDNTNTHGIKYSLDGGQGQHICRRCSFRENEEDGVQTQCTFGNRLIVTFDDCLIGPDNQENPFDIKGDGSIRFRDCIIDGRGGIFESVVDHAGVTGEVDSEGCTFIGLSGKICVRINYMLWTSRRNKYIGTGRWAVVIGSTSQNGHSFTNDLLYRRGTGSNGVVQISGGTGHEFIKVTAVSDGASHVVEQNAGSSAWRESILYALDGALIDRNGGTITLAGNHYERVDSSSNWYLDGATARGESDVGTANFDSTGTKGDPGFVGTGDVITDHPYDLDPSSDLIGTRGDTLGITVDLRNRARDTSQAPGAYDPGAGGSPINEPSPADSPIDSPTTPESPTDSPVPAVSPTPDSGPATDAPTFRSFSTYSAPQGSEFSHTLTEPADVENGDLLIMLAAPALSNANEISVDDGWNHIASVDRGSLVIQLHAWWKIRDGSEDYTLTMVHSRRIVASVIAYEVGTFDPDDPIDGFASDIDISATPNAPSVTTLAAKTAIIRAFGAENADDGQRENNAADFPVGHEALYLLASEGGGTDVTGGAARTEQLTAGASGTASFTLQNEREWAALTIAIAGGPGPAVESPTPESPTPISPESPTGSPTDSPVESPTTPESPTTDFSPITGSPVSGGRDLPTDVQTHLAGSVVRPVFIVEIETFNRDASPSLEYVRAWTGIGPLEWAGKTFPGVGNLGGISNIRESADLAAHGIALKLSGVPSETISLVLGNEYQGRKIDVWIGFLEDDGTLIFDPVKLGRWRGDTSVITDDAETAEIELRAESRLADHERPREVRYTHEAQQRLFPGDKGFEHVERLLNAEIVFGR